MKDKIRSLEKKLGSSEVSTTLTSLLHQKPIKRRVGPEFIELTRTKSDTFMDDVKGCIVLYRNLNTHSSWNTIEVTSKEIIISNLDPETQYIFRLYTQNMVIVTVWSVN